MGTLLTVTSKVGSVNIALNYVVVMVHNILSIITFTGSKSNLLIQSVIK